MPALMAALRRRQDDRNLLPPDLSGTHAAVEERHLFSDCGCRAGSGLPSLPALPAGNRARSRRLARHVEHSVARLEPDRARRAGRGRCRRSGRTPRRRRAPVAALVPAAHRRLAGRGRADKARAARQAAHSRDASADDRSGVRRGLPQHSPFQRDVPAVVRPLAARIAPDHRAGIFDGGCRRACSAAALSATVRLGRDNRVPAAARNCRHRVCRRAALRAHAATRRPNGNSHSRAGGRQRVARHRAFPKTLGVAHHHRAAATAYSISAPIRWLSPRILQRIRRWRRS